MRRALFEIVVCLALMVWLAACSSGHSSPSDGPSLKANPKTIKNPVASTPESLATGKRLTIGCGRHGTAATGGVMAGKRKSSPREEDPKLPDWTMANGHHGPRVGE